MAFALSLFDLIGVGFVATIPSDFLSIGFLVHRISCPSDSPKDGEILDLVKIGQNYSLSHSTKLLSCPMLQCSIVCQSPRPILKPQMREGSK